MTVGDTLIAFGLLAIIVVITCEACWRARVPRWHHPRGGAAQDRFDRRFDRPFRNALGGGSSNRVEGHQGK